MSEMYYSRLKTHKMKTNNKQNNSKKHQPDNRIMQLSDFSELNDYELERLVGGWSSASSSTTASKGLASH